MSPYYREINIPFHTTDRTSSLCKDVIASYFERRIEFGNALKFKMAGECYLKCRYFPSYNSFRPIYPHIFLSNQKFKTFSSFCDIGGNNIDSSVCFQTISLPRISKTFFETNFFM